MQEQGSTPAVAENSNLPRMESVNRISKIPIVESVWGVATGFYGKVKESNSVVSWTLSHAEVVSTAAIGPVASRLETPLHAVDSMLCKGIDMVEEKVPAIKMPPSQMLATTREYVATGLGLHAQGPDTPATAKIIGAGVGVAAAGLRTAVSAVEWYVDRYLPSQQGEDEAEDKALVPAKEGGEGAKNDPMDALLRLQKVTRRLQRRLIRIASAQIKSLKQQGEGATTYVGGVAQYITSVVADPKALVSKVGTAWAEMARQLQDEEGDKGHGFPKVMARKLARRVVGALDNARATIVTIPGGVYSRLNSTANYGISIIGGFLSVSSKNGDKDSSNGHSSEERAQLLCMRQEKATSPPPAVQPVKTATSDKGSSTEEKRTAVPTNDKVSESIAVAN
ncbi:lipid storage droplets surface-binding protein 1-like isoform X2 [Hetaerina americana]